ncbi:amidase [Actinokineospora globicatena]|uniref:amidase n=1 Tax=Actinokineospora globicatena TaxID=103729 RepID=UPI0020A46530|nr:amidase [Actinokineospora globicatena]MCP2303925.1 aspartyl-tRNA(Asn)/glutamyl-tRNA(Gln) amidotransferase subunit A [Actinokineospora globicatena]GLW78915.1 amidase [Actinokineospora globicatena]GLW86673.1 amidase [Actinokineospora globicatena]
MNGGHEVHELPITELGTLLRAGAVTAIDLAEHTLNRIHAIDGRIDSFILVTAERAMADASRADAELAAGVDRGPLHGIPYALKDIYATAGIRTTCNSRLLLDNIPAEDSEVQTRLARGGGVLVGKLNTAEFALGGGTDLPFPQARNPWNTEHFTGTSSTGSGAAVGAGLVRLAMGSDTGGSIRSPACHCGVVGLKPTYGLVSRRGVYPLSFSLDHCGPITRSVADAAVAMDVVAGHDPGDPSSAAHSVVDHTADLALGVEGVRIGYARDLFADTPGVSPEVVASVDAAAHLLAGLGAVVEEVRLPDFDLFKACGRIIMLAEAFAIHEDTLRSRPLDYGRYTYQRIAAGATLSAADLVQAQRLRRELTVELNNGPLAKYDVLLTTTGLAPAARLDEFPRDWPPPGVSVAVQTAPFNVTGNPALSVPSGFSASGMPMGIQLVGRPFDERTVLRVGAAFESAVGVSHLYPRLDPAEHVT